MEHGNSKYSQEIYEKAKKYLDNYESHGHAFPSEVGLADVLDVSVSTVQNWGNDKRKSDFLGILEKIKAKQEIVAWRKGLTGEYNASLCKLLLGKHGYSDKVDQNNTGEQKLNVETSIKETDKAILERFLESTLKKCNTGNSEN